MSNDAMTAKEAAILLVALDVETVVAQAIATVVNRLAELESLTVFPPEWGVRWVDEDGAFEDPDDGTEFTERAAAERIAVQYPDARLVKRLSFRSAWTQVETS